MISSSKKRTALSLLLSCMLLSSCSAFFTKALVGPALENMQEQSDLELVCEGTPSYLLMIDSLIAADPDDPGLLTVGAKAYSGYIGAMTECGLSKDRISAMADKALYYSKALLLELLHISVTDSYQSFQDKLLKASKYDAEQLFWAAFAWVSWVRQQEGAPAAMVDLGKIEKILLRIVELDETVQQGSAHFLLGGFYGSRPLMFGGKPEQSRYHFERALKLSQRKMLIFQTTYAETYARITMDKTLHDALLDEVIDFSLESHRQNLLANLIAQRRAERLLQEKFFEE